MQRACSSGLLSRKALPTKAVYSALLSTYQTQTQTQTTTTNAAKVCPDPDTIQGQSMQPQPQMPGQSMPPNVGVVAVMGQSHQTLQPQYQLPPYQQSVMPQTSVVSGPPPRAVEEAQKISQRNKKKRRETKKEVISKKKR